MQQCDKDGNLFFSTGSFFTLKIKILARSSFQRMLPDQDRLSCLCHSVKLERSQKFFPLQRSLHLKFKHQFDNKGEENKVL